MNARELLNALDAFEQEKGISKEVVVEALKEALEKAYKKHTDPDVLCRADINGDLGTIEMYELKNVVVDVEDDLFEIELEDAREVNPNINIGEVLEIPVDTETLSRLAALQAKQVLTQKIREFEKQTVYDAYIDKKDDIIVGTIDRIEPGFIIVNVGKSNAVMKINHTIPGESFKPGQTVRVYVVDVDKSSQGAAVIVSRTVPGFLKRLFESEIPEIYDGTVEIKHISREAGDRAKVSVFSRNKDVDATGACIGQKGLRIQKISNQILGEKIDVINYYEDSVLYIAEALKPAEVIGVAVDEETKNAIAVVKDDSFSLAIGKRGINARLAVSLTGYKIDIKTLTNAVSEGIEYTSVEQAKANYEYNRSIPVVEEPVVDDEVVEDTIKIVEEEPVKVEVEKVEEKAQEKPKEEVKSKSEKPLKMPKFLKEDNVKPSKKEETRSSGNSKKKKDDEKEVKRTIISSKELEDIKKKNEEARSYMPVYTDDELEELDDDVEEDNYYDEVDYDEYDKYYDED
jgi:N utilization substance protein A